MIEVEFSCSPIAIQQTIYTESPFRCQLVYTGRVISNDDSVLEFVGDPETVEWCLGKLEGELIALIGLSFRARVVHRLGTVGSGQMTSVIITEANHHDQAFLVQRSIVESLKHQCPIWKLEVNGKGGTWKARRERG